MCKLIETNVYIDPPFRYSRKRVSYSHMISDDLYHLHQFAQSIGLKRHWFENKLNKHRPHYDVPEEFYTKAIEAGALPIVRRNTFKLLKIFQELKKHRIAINTIINLNKINNGGNK